MTKLGFKTWFLRVIIDSSRGLVLVFKYASFFFVRIGRLLWRLVGWLALPLVVIAYRLLLAAKRRLTLVTDPLRSTFFFIFSHRHVIHVAALVLTLITSLASLGTRTARAEDLGTRSILYALVTGTSEEVLEEEAATAESPAPTEYLIDVVAVSPAPAIDFDYLDESYVSTVTGARAVLLPPGAVTSGPTRTKTETHTVADGETVSSIADTFGLSIDTLLQTNKLTVRSYIRPGDKLTILPQDGVLHAVKKNDTVDKLAGYYKANAHDILVWNNLGAEAGLEIGASLFVPGGKLPVPPTRRSPGTIFARPAGVPAPPGFFKFWPTAARRITQYFGWRHTGLDIAGPTGTAIYAAEDGIVEYAGWTRGYGQNVVINHGNGFKTRYAHNSKNFVIKGAQVKKGESVAAMGSTGRSTGPHVHFEIIAGGRFRNPLEYIR